MLMNAHFLGFLLQEIVEVHHFLFVLYIKYNIKATKHINYNV